MNITAIRHAIANQINTFCGIRALGEARDSISPPICIVLPGGTTGPLVTFGATMDGENVLSFRVYIIVGDAQPTEKAQKMLDGLCGLNQPGELSVADAIVSDPSLGGAVSWCEPISVTNYGRLEWAAVPYFGCVLNVNVGV